MIEFYFRISIGEKKGITHWWTRKWGMEIIINKEMKCSEPIRWAWAFKSKNKIIYLIARGMNNFHSLENFNWIIPSQNRISSKRWLFFEIMNNKYLHKYFLSEIFYIFFLSNEDSGNDFFLFYIFETWKKRRKKYAKTKYFKQSTDRNIKCQNDI